MKSHFIPEPELHECEPREQWSAGKPALAAGLWVDQREGSVRKEFQRPPELPMLNFLRVVFAQ